MFTASTTSTTPTSNGTSHSTSPDRHHHHHAAMFSSLIGISRPESQHTNGVSQSMPVLTPQITLGANGGAIFSDQAENTHHQQQQQAAASQLWNSLLANALNSPPQASMLPPQLTTVTTTAAAMLPPQLIPALMAQCSIGSGGQTSTNMQALLASLIASQQAPTPPPQPQQPTMMDTQQTGGQGTANMIWLSKALASLYGFHTMKAVLDAQQQQQQQQSNNAQQLLSQTLLAAQAMGISNSDILRWATDAHASSLCPPPGASANHLQQHSPMAIDEELPLDLSLGAGRASVGAMSTNGVKTGQQPKRPKKVNSQGGVGSCGGASQFQQPHQQQQQQGIPLPSSIFPSPPTSQHPQHTGRGVNRSASSVSSFSPTNGGSGGEPDPLDHIQQSLSRGKWASRSGHQALQRHYPQYRSVRTPHSQRKQLYYQQQAAGATGTGNGTTQHQQQSSNGALCSPVLSGQAMGKEKELVEDHFRRALGDAYDAYFNNGTAAQKGETLEVVSNGFAPTAMETDSHQQHVVDSSVSHQNGHQNGGEWCNGVSNGERNGHHNGMEKEQGGTAEDDEDLDRLVIVTDDDCCLLLNGASHS